MKYSAMLFLTLAVITGLISCSKEPGQEPDLTPKSLTLTSDKPFVFAIRERTTNTLLFIGQVVNPMNP